MRSSLPSRPADAGECVGRGIGMSPTIETTYATVPEPGRGCFCAASSSFIDEGAQANGIVNIEPDALIGKLEPIDLTRPIVAAVVSLYHSSALTRLRLIQL